MGQAAEDAAADLMRAIKLGLRAAADPSRAPQMQAYMKSEMPYLGVPLPLTRSLTKRAAADHPPPGLPYLIDGATALWRTADYREERYAATELTGLRMAAGRLELLPLYSEIIVTGAWWDHVDAVSQRIGTLLTAHRAAIEPVVRSWSTDDDRWLRRCSIICQLALREHTDTALLRDVIEPNLADPEFFVRKAIGWALRQYARTDPDWVRGFVRANAGTISSLSRREALKHLT